MHDIDNIMCTIVNICRAINNVMRAIANIANLISNVARAINNILREISNIAHGLLLFSCHAVHRAASRCAPLTSVSRKIGGGEGDEGQLA
jgi:phage-related protein